ncbi:hypothetical protein HYALB_00005214 [Hymenoscyphus albidus]|uniref:Opsin-1 n=1 Tax=Hymenoscyphus albidus TaxID=595503 RepID=A0A9N9LUP9_9HELO|nr:hypothetical protein HYALB_00005214 [Hymenoscyphus albidus]
MIQEAISPEWVYKTKNPLYPTTGLPPVPELSPKPTDVSPIPTVVPTPDYYETLGDVGHTTLWVVFALMLISTIIFTGLAWRVPVQKRLFHVITTFITLFATLSYFAMATGDGNSFAQIVIHTRNKHVPDTVEYVYRQVFWARYVDWSVTTPLLLLDLAFLAGLDGASIIVTIVADLIMVLLGLFAAFGSSDGQKWGYYAMACAAYLVIVYQLAVGGRRAISSKDRSTSSLFNSLGLFTFVLWTLYPIVWGIGDGARKWSVDVEIVAYAILDVLAKPVFGFWLLFAHRKAPAIEGWWSSGIGQEGSVRLEDEGA